MAVDITGCKDRGVLRIDELIDRAPMGALQWRVVALCTVVAMLDGFDMQAIALAAPEIAREWNLEIAGFGVIYGIGLVGVMVGALLAGTLADHVGRRWPIIVAVLIFGVATLATVRVGSMDDLFWLRLATGAGIGASMPNVIALASEYAPRRLQASVVVGMFCGFPLGALIGGLASAALIEDHGWRAIFYLGGSIPLAAAVVLAIGLPESIRFLVVARASPDRILRIVKQIGGTRTAATIEPAPVDTRSAGLGVARLFSDGRRYATPLLWIANFASLLVLYFLLNWLPALLRQSGLSIETAIRLAVVLNLGGIAGGFAYGYFMDRLNPHIVLTAGYALGAIAVALLAQAEQPMMVALAIFAAGFTVVGGQLAINAVTAALYPTSLRATGAGWALGIGRVGSILGPLAGGALLAAGWHASELFSALIIPSVMAALAVLMLGRLRGVERDGIAAPPD